MKPINTVKEQSKNMLRL